MKPKEEQRKELEEYAQPYANEDCKICLGRGFSGYNNVEKRFIICECVELNIGKELALMQTDNPQDILVTDFLN